MTATEASLSPTSVAWTSDSHLRRRGWIALLEVLALIGLTLIIMRGELPHMYIEFFANPDAAHTWVVPILMGLLIYRWREPLLRGLKRGSPWGVALILLGLGMFIVTSWPLNYGFVRRVSVLPMIAGAVLAVCGWRVFWLCIPIYILAALAIPTGSRYYAFLIIGPETKTIEFTTSVLNLWPGVFVDANGPDLHYISDSASGTIALGESNRGVSMIIPMMAIGVFVTFASFRSIWKYALCLVLLIPIALLCNFIRFVLLGCVTIAGGCEPVSGTPRAVSAVVSLALVYGIFALIAWLLGGRDPSDAALITEATT